MIKYVKATSGDQYSDLQGAIDALMASTDTSKVLVLHGLYSTSAPLVVGTRAADTHISICGVGVSRITYTGALTTSPVLLLNRCRPTEMPAVSNISIYCGTKARGIRCYRCIYCTPLSRIIVRNSLEVGCDLINCYGSRFEHIYMQIARGIGYRVTTGNACQFHDIKHWYGRSAHNPDGEAATDTMMRYEHVNGQAATIVEYGAKYVEYWPATDDATVVDESGNAVQTPANERAAVVIVFNGKGMTWEGVQFERNHYGDYPLVFAGDWNMNLTMRQLYFESNLNRLEKILVRGGATSTSRTFMYNFSGINSQDSLLVGEAYVGTEAFVRLENRTSQVSVSDLAGYRYGAIITCDGGVHQAPTVSNARTWGNEIAAANWVASVNDAEVLATAQDGDKIQNAVEQET